MIIKDGEHYGLPYWRCARCHMSFCKHKPDRCPRCEGTLPRLGDYVAIFASLLGYKPTPKCGCVSRKKWLNQISDRLWPFSRK